MRAATDSEKGLRMKLYGVFGKGGYGREVMPQVAEAAANNSNQYEAVFVDDSPDSCQINGRTAMSWCEFRDSEAEEKEIVIAVGDSQVREELSLRCKAHGVPFFSTIAHNAVVMDDVVMGEGAIISPFVTITSNVRIGRHFHANLYSYVAHDCVIGDYVTFAPGVHCNGNIHIEDFAYIGAGAVVRPGVPGRPLKIGRGAVIGMGAVVTKDVPERDTVVGNPARVLAANN